MLYHHVSYLLNIDVILFGEMYDAEATHVQIGDGGMTRKVGNKQEEERKVHTER